MEIIDFHAHIYPQKIAEKAAENIGRFYTLAMSQKQGTAEVLIEQGNRSGISRFLVHSVANVPNQAETINNFIADSCDKHPQFTGFGTIHADMDDPFAEIERIQSLGLKGIKIHPDTQRFNMDSPKMMEIYDAISGKLPIAIHCGDYRYDYSHPKRLAKILDNFKNLTIVAAHFGGWSVWDLALEFLEEKVKGTNCFFDTASSMPFLGKKRTFELIHSYTPDRMVFGTDFPMWGAETELELLQSLDLTPQELEQILSGNAKRILGELGT